jgi:Zn finger protein HypA/HybF involved in hydrogenase expression
VSLRSPSEFLPSLLWIAIAIAPAAMTKDTNAQTPPPSSASACASCHRAQTVNQPNTPMGRATILLPQNTTLKTHPKMTVQRGPYTYTVEFHGDQATYTVTDGKRTVSYPIHWSFGNGVQAWLLEHDGKISESLVSYYPETDSLNLTIGDEALKPQTLEEAASRDLTEKVVKDCFGCHSTNAVINGKLSLKTAEPGVTCEHCHQGATTHMIAASQGQFDIPPPSLSKLSSEDLSSFCGQCHRSWETVIRNGWKGPANVRFAPYRLSSSKCFDGSDSRIGCTACHDPHQNVVRNDAFYDSKCLACHNPTAHAPSSTALRGAKTCPVSQKDCVSCHMPKSKLPDENVTFTDHWIRIVKPGDPYPN